MWFCLPYWGSTQKYCFLCGTCGFIYCTEDQHNLNKHHAIKTNWGSGGRDPFCNLGTRWRWAISFTPKPLYLHGKSPWYPLDRQPGGPRVGLDMVSKRKIPSPHWELNPDHLIIQPIVSHYKHIIFFIGPVVLFIVLRIHKKILFSLWDL